MFKDAKFDHLKDKSILVTGGTGSFGKEFIKTLIDKSEAKKIIIFSRDELKQYELQQKYKHEKRLRFFIGDIRDLSRLEMAFNGVDFVVHAAALKQVPMLEYNPFEAVKTNVIGTQNVIEAAIKQNVKKVILISTDKAANPANLYGATKLCAERLMVSSNSYSAGKTAFSCVRYGNVFGSRGSLVELIENQKKNGEITITHEEMTRYWITLTQGVNLVVNALNIMAGGEIFIPKIPSMKVKDLITILAPGCKVKIIGIRPGEKLHEKLITEEEARHAKEFENYYIIEPEFEWWQADSKQGKILPENFYYSSDNNTEWFDGESLNKLIANC